jgi:phospholipase/lecithinase/hemolysin
MANNSLFRVLRRGVITLAVLVSTSSAALASYSQVVFFGDSLSDTGNFYSSSGGIFPVSTPGGYYNGRFSNGPVWSEVFAGALGLSANPSSTGGTNYAWAGATVGNYGRLLPNGSPIPLLPDQLATYFANSGAADPNALYVIMGGANDIAEASANPGTAPARLIGAAHSVGAMVETLYAEGARNILVGNLPNVGRTPQAAIAGPAAVAGATALSQLFNATLESMLSVSESTHSDLDIDRLDIYRLIEDLVADPASQGFSDVTDPCKSGAKGLPGPVCSDPNSYLFWDIFHPSTHAHALISDAALRAVPEPAALALIAIALVAMMWVGRLKQNIGRAGVATVS